MGIFIIFILILAIGLLVIIRWPIILIGVVPIVAIPIILKTIKKRKKDNFSKKLSTKQRLLISEVYKIRHDSLTEEEINNFDEKQIINYFKKNDNLLFNIVLPMYNLAVDNNYINADIFVGLLKEAFLLDAKANTIQQKMQHVQSISSQYYEKLDKSRKDATYDIWSNTSQLKWMYVGRTYFFMDHYPEWAKGNLEAISSAFNNSDTCKIATSFILNTYMFTFAKILVYKKLVDKINSCRKSDFYKILNNALNKFDSEDKAAEKTYDIFLNYFQFEKEQFSLTDYKEFLSFMKEGMQKRTKLYEKDIILKLNLEDLSKSILLQYEPEKLAKSIIYHKMLQCENLVEFFNQYRELSGLIDAIKTQQEKEDLLYNDYSSQNKVTIYDIDLMSGTDFELFVKELLESMHYKCQLTKTTGDQGIDIIAEKDKVKIAVQTKCYSNKVGNHAIMEAVAGMKHYSASKCMVITNNYFTKKAIELANSNSVILWDRDALVEKMCNR